MNNNVKTTIRKATPVILGPVSLVPQKSEGKIIARFKDEKKQQLRLSCASNPNDKEKANGIETGFIDSYLMSVDTAKKLNDMGIDVIRNSYLMRLHGSLAIDNVKLDNGSYRTYVNIYVYDVDVYDKEKGSFTGWLLYPSNETPKTATEATINTTASEISEDDLPF